MTLASSVAPAPRVGVRSHPWVRFAVRRLGRLLVSLWVLVTASFLMIHLIPGDPVRAALGPTAPAELVAARREALGLNDPLLVQYWHYLQDLFTGDLGTSIDLAAAGLATSSRSGCRPRSSWRCWRSSLAVAVAVPLGVAMAVLTRRGHGRRTELGFTTEQRRARRPSPTSCSASASSTSSASASAGCPSPGNDTPASYMLPVLALAIGPAAILSRIVRVEMLAVLEADFVRTARAKRLPAPTVYLGHALPNALTATLTLGGLILSALVAGTVLVENVFAWPGPRQHDRRRRSSTRTTRWCRPSCSSTASACCS